MCSMFVIFKHTLIYDTSSIYTTCNQFLAISLSTTCITKESVSQTITMDATMVVMAKSQSLMMTATRLRTLMKMKEESGGDY